MPKGRPTVNTGNCDVMALPNVVIVLGRCRRQQAIFGIRLEEKEPRDWVCDWAFPVRDQTAKRERFDQTEITGSFKYDPNYPGCPYCGSKSTVRCSCGKVGCYNGKSWVVKCPWCGRRGIVGSPVDRLTSGCDV